MLYRILYAINKYVAKWNTDIFFNILLKTTKKSPLLPITTSSINLNKLL